MSGGHLNLTGTPISMNGSDLTVTSGNIIISGGNATSVTPTGIIKSADYDYEQRKGWALDHGNLYLFDGEIKAELIDIQSEQNLIDYGYSTMMYPPEWYKVNVQFSGAIEASLTSVWSRYGDNSLRLQGDNNDRFEMTRLLSDDSKDFSRIRVEPGSQYIASAWIYNQAVTTKSLRLYFASSDGGFVESATFSFEPGESRRISLVGTVPDVPGATGAYVGVLLKSDGSDFAIDGMQFEPRTGSDEPSTFNFGGGTTIDGNSIETGSIVSNNYLEGSDGWKISMDGEVEFQGGIFRGELFASDLVSGTIDNQEYQLSDIESFIEDADFADGWTKTQVLKNTVFRVGI